MTLQQLRYVIMVASKGTISEAAKELFISQPSLTNAIKELEKEINIELFIRTNKGVVLSREGDEFLGYARQVIAQVDLLDEKYNSTKASRRHFAISTQHYSFAVNAFVDLIRLYGKDAYDFHIRETQTHEIIEDVSKMRSEIGVLYLSDFNKEIIMKFIKSNNLKFTELFEAVPHIFISKKNPLAHKEIVTLQDLIEFPYLSFEQGDFNSFYFSEEILSTIERKKNIHVRDRATLFNLLIGLNGYTICSGIISKELNGKDIISIPLDVDEKMHIGYITHKRSSLSFLGEAYVQEIKKYTDNIKEEDKPSPYN